MNFFLWLSDKYGTWTDCVVQLCLSFPQVLSTSGGTYPMFIFSEGRSREDDGSEAPTNSITYIQRKKERKRVDTSGSMDEFVLLWTEEICDK